MRNVFLCAASGFALSCIGNKDRGDANPDGTGQADDTVIVVR